MIDDEKCITQSFSHDYTCYFKIVHIDNLFYQYNRHSLNTDTQVSPF